MQVLITIKCLLFLEGLLLFKFSPRILLDTFSTNQNILFQYIFGYIFAFSWVWFVDRTRRISSTLITLMIFSFLLKTLKNHVTWYYEFFYIFFTSMIVPITCAFAMMQLSPKQERERWPLQYVFLILGRLLRTCFIEKLFAQYETVFDTIFTAVFVILVATIPWIQKRKLTLDGVKKSVQIYSPISSLLGQSRYLYFLISVIFASFFFFYTRKSVELLHKFSVHSALNFITEIVVCLLAYFVVPHRFPPQAFFLLGQALIAFRCIAYFSGCPLFFMELLEIVLASGFTVTTIANAQIIATHAKPGLEFTTCALVDICKSGIAPAIFVLFSNFITLETALIGCVMFLMAFTFKYYLIDYSHDNLIKKKLLFS